MARLTLVIADSDKFYVEGLEDFLIDKYSNRFQINTFTKESNLMNFLSNLEKKVDILLISSDLFKDSIPKAKYKTIIILSDGRVSNDAKGLDVISKFQHGEKLVNCILNIYSDKNNEDSIIINGQKITKIICSFSPVGGSGKTSVLSALAVQTALRGKEVLYLDLESFSSTGFIFGQNPEKSISNLFYHVKEKNKNIHLKIEMQRAIHESSKVHYFSPPESSLELEEMTSIEICSLVDEIRSMNFYDVVFIDLSSNIGKMNYSVMELVDEVLLVIPHDRTAEARIKQFDKDIEIISRKMKKDLRQKIKLVVNKCSAEKDFDNFIISGFESFNTISRIENFENLYSIEYFTNTSSVYTREINTLLDDIKI